MQAGTWRSPRYGAGTPPADAHPRPWRDRSVRGPRRYRRNFRHAPIPGRRCPARRPAATCRSVSCAAPSTAPETMGRFSLGCSGFGGGGILEVVAHEIGDRDGAVVLAEVEVRHVIHGLG